MEATPAISIITPVYNGERFISGCIESVAAQNCTNLEHIIVDGGSTDRTMEIIREKAKTCSYLRWISEPDRGQSDAMNKGIAMATAEFVGILNVDDFYEPGALSRVTEIIRSLTVPRFVVGACNVITADGKLLYVNRPNVLKFENIVVDDVMWPPPYNPAAYFYPKAVHKVIGPYNVEEHQCMDWEFILAVIQAIEPLYIDVVFGNMRYYEGTKTYNSVTGGSLRPLQLKIRKAAWKRAPLKTKIRVAFLWISHRRYRLKVAYWNFRRRLSLSRLTR